jgi:hypothetical protein
MSGFPAALTNYDSVNAFSMKARRSFYPTADDANNVCVFLSTHPYTCA